MQFRERFLGSWADFEYAARSRLKEKDLSATFFPERLQEFGIEWLRSNPHTVREEQDYAVGKQFSCNHMFSKIGILGPDLSPDFVMP